MTSPPQGRRPEELIAAYLEGALPPEDEARLNAWLASGAENMRQFLRQLELHSALHETYAQLESPLLPQEAPRAASSTRMALSRETARKVAEAGSGRRLPRLLGAAALILIGLLAVIALTSRKDGSGKDGFTRTNWSDQTPSRPDPQDASGKAREQNARLEPERTRLEEQRAGLDREKERLNEVEKRRLEEARLREPQDQDRVDPAKRIVEQPKAIDLARDPQQPGKSDEPKSLPPAPVPPRQTVTEVGTLSWVQGEVYFVEGEKRILAREGDRLHEGRGLDTTGPLGGAQLTFADSSRLELLERTSIREIAGGQPGSAKRVYVLQGTVDAKVAKQPAGQPMLFATPHGEAKVLGTVFRLQVNADPKEGMRLEVQDGKVQLKNLSGEMVEVPGASSAVAAAGVPLTAKRMSPQDVRKKGAGAVDPKTDRAILRGIAYLKNPGTRIEERDEELVLWTMIHAGVPESDPDFQKQLKGILQRDLTRTYTVSLQAMILEELDRVKYQARIYHCAQFLIDNQCANGQWSYGTPTVLTDAPEGKAVATPSGSPPRKSDAGLRPKPKVLKKIPIMKTRDGPGIGDNSNSQYAALGLRACHDAGIELPREAVERAKKWWQDTLILDPGQDPKARVASGEGAGAAGGWGYGNGKISFGSMSAGAVGSLVIYQHLLGQPWMRDQTVLSGLKWLSDHFSVTDNANVDRAGYPADSNFSYYLYALERVGMLYGTETLGKHEWYSEGVQGILKTQKADGSWENSGWEGRKPVWDTCFIILFLRRATRPIDIASEDRFVPRK